jgi:hypothetical protein
MPAWIALTSSFVSLRVRSIPETSPMKVGLAGSMGWIACEIMISSREIVETLSQALQKLHRVFAGWDCGLDA